MIKVFPDDLHIYTYTQWRLAEKNYSVNMHTIRVRCCFGTIDFCITIKQKILNLN